MYPNRVLRGVAALILVVALAGCAMLPWDRPAATFSPEPGPDPAPAVTQPPQPTTGVVGIVIDPTASTGRTFRESVRTAIVDQLAAVVPAKPTDAAQGVAPVNGISVQLKLVVTNGYAYGSPTLSVEIPPVRGLASRPPVNTTTMDDGTYAAWKQAKTAWEQEYGTALAAQAAAVRELGSFSLTVPGAQRSGISSTLGALAASIPPTNRAAFIVASDLEENVTSAVTGTLDGHPVTLIVPCNASATACAARQDNFAAWATDELQAGPVTAYRPENTAQAIAAAFSEVLS